MMSDALDLFEDSLGTLFSHIQPALSGPGQFFTYKNTQLGEIKIKLPPHEVTSLFAHYCWRAGLLVADMIGTGQLKLQGLTVLELGSGAALPSFCSVKQGAKMVVASDYEEPSVLSNISNNADNVLSKEERKRMRVLPLTWGNASHEDDILDVVPAKFDHILACDCVWVQYAHDDLLISVTHLLKKTKEARMTVCCGFHTGRPVVVRFFDRARYHGLELDGPIVEHEVGGSTRPFTEDGTFQDKSERNRWLVVASLRWQEAKLA